MKYLSLITFLFFSLVITAQDYKFGKVSKEELQEKFNPLDSSARATYLYKYRKTFFEYDTNYGFQLITEVHERIKIYNNEGFDFATKQVSLYEENNQKESFYGLKAYTYSLVDGKVVETKLKKDGVFEEKVSENFSQAKFTLPNIDKGCVVEYKYKISSPFYWVVDEFLFQHDIPIKKLDAIFESPEYFVFKINTKGFLPVSPIKNSNSRTLNYKSEVSLSDNSAGDPSKNYRQGEVEYTNNTYSYNLENITALYEEPYVNNIENYRSSVKFELSYTIFPRTPIKYYTTDWEDVVKTIYKSKNFGEQLNKSKYYKNILDQAIETEADISNKIAIVYNLVKNKVKWNGDYGKYTKRGVESAFRQGLGNVAEINLMLISMLRNIGVDANPVLVSTRSNGIPIFPTNEGFNYVLCSVQLAEGVVLLDATSLYSMPNILPYRALNWEGRIIKKNGSSSVISLFSKEMSNNTITMMVKLFENGDLEGSYRGAKTRHNALLYRNKFNKSNEDSFVENLENKYGGIEVSNFKVVNSKNLSKPVMESYKFIKESQADVIGDKIYFSPLFFLATKENLFKLEKREFPIDFGYPSKSIYRISMILPEGFQIESIPKSSAVTLPENLGMFKYTISQADSKIQLIIDSEINESIISPMYYEVLKEFFKQMIEKENEQVVLAKIKA